MLITLKKATGKKNKTFPNESGEPVGVIRAYWFLVAAA